VSPQNKMPFLFEACFEHILANFSFCRKIQKSAVLKSTNLARTKINIAFKTNYVNKNKKSNSRTIFTEILENVKIRLL